MHDRAGECSEREMEEQPSQFNYNFNHFCSSRSGGNDGAEMNFMKRAPNCRAQHKLLSVSGDSWQEQEQKLENKDAGHREQES